MILKTRLFGHVYEFKSIREVMAKANEEKSGDVLAGVAAKSGLLGRLAPLANTVIFPRSLVSTTRRLS